MKWYPLSPGHWILFLVIVALADVCTIVQRYVVPEIFRPITYGAIVIILFLVFFFIVRPSEPMVLAQTLSVVLGVITLLLILVQDVILTYNLSWKAIVIFLGAILGPIIAGYLFRAIHFPDSSK
jgi:hypothetical protein